MDERPFRPGAHAAHAEPGIDLIDPPGRSFNRRGAGKAVRPRDAATLILVRRDGAEPRVLMGRRHHGHSFMPEKWVFPGGKLDRSDFHAPHASDLHANVAAQLHASPSRARALALAAVRETFEETGLLLGRPAAARVYSGPWRDFVAHGALPDLAALDYVARAVTPPAVGKRFDARFFMADAGGLLSFDPVADCGELDEIGWFSLQEAHGLDVAGITRFVLADLALRLHDPQRPIPFVRVINGARHIAHI
jgi:8-oxo-dGTP pyrophosphatase MutT (NUDIX family)